MHLFEICYCVSKENIGSLTVTRTQR